MLGRFPVSLVIPVAWGEMDAFRHVNNTVYLRWFETARIEYFQRVGFLASPSLSPILARTSIDFRRPVAFPDTIVVDATVTKMGSSSATMVYRVTSRAQNALAAEGEAIVVAFDYTRGTKVPIPDDLRERVEALEAGAPPIAL